MGAPGVRASFNLPKMVSNVPCSGCLEGNTAARAFYERQGWVKGKPIRLETIGGTEITEVRYERGLELP